MKNSKESSFPAPSDNPDKGRELTEATAELFRDKALLLEKVLKKDDKGFKNIKLDGGVEILVCKYQAMTEIIAAGGVPDELYVQLGVIITTKKEGRPDQLESYDYLENGRISLERTVYDAHQKRKTNEEKRKLLDAIDGMKIVDGELQMDAGEVHEAIDEKTRTTRDLWDAGLIVADEDDVARANAILDEALKKSGL